jgi:RNA polymerase sigma factor (sigma-70 family)
MNWDEVQELAESFVRNPSLDVRNQLVEKVRPYQYKIAQDLIYHGVSYFEQTFRLQLKYLDVNDLVQGASEDLLKSLQNYDPSKGAFSNFVMMHAVFSMTRTSVNEDFMIRIPALIFNKYFHVFNFQGIEALVEYIGKENSRRFDVREYWRAAAFVFTLNGIYKDLWEVYDTDESRRGSVSRKDYFESRLLTSEVDLDLSLDLKKVVPLIEEALSEREREVLFRRVLLEESLESIGGSLEISRQRTGQIERTVFLKSLRACKRRDLGRIL